MWMTNPLPDAALQAKAPAMPPVLPGSHSDAVLGLSWNAEYRNVLASGSGEPRYIMSLHLSH